MDEMLVFKNMYYALEVAAEQSSIPELDALVEELKQASVEGGRESSLQRAKSFFSLLDVQHPHGLACVDEAYAFVVDYLTSIDPRFAQSFKDFFPAQFWALGFES